MTAPIDLEALRGHTPGPWEVDSTRACMKLIRSRSHHAGQIATVYENHDANARLIAAAPALLAELTTRRARDAEVEALVAAAKRVLDKEWEYGDDQPHCVALSAAIENLAGANT